MIYSIISIPLWYYAMSILAFGLCYMLFHKWDRKRRLGASILVAYVLLLFSATVLSRQQNESVKLQLNPFWSYSNLAGSIRNGFLAQVILNVLVFVPIAGILMSINHNQKITLLLCIGLSLSIEIVQLVTRKGLCETDDLIHNTIGSFLGIRLYMNRKKIIELLRCVASRLHKQK